MKNLIFISLLFFIIGCYPLREREMEISSAKIIEMEHIWRAEEGYFWMAHIKDLTKGGEYVIYFPDNTLFKKGDILPYPILIPK